MSYHLIQPLFPSGDLLLSPAILGRGFDVHPLLRRHFSGDWGEISDYDRNSNDSSLAEGAELLSQYTAPDAQQVSDLLTIVTAADRSYTVVFLPGESQN